MKKTIAATITALSLALAAQGWAEEGGHAGHGSHEAKAPVETENVVKEEMRLLDAAFKNLLDALLLGRPETIEAPFHEVHHAKMATEKALHAGQVKLPKNGDRLEEFVEMDEAFHGRLEALLKAARKRDGEAIRKVTHELLDGCVSCHDRFRN